MRSASARRRSLFTTLCVPLLACTALVTLDPAPPPASAASGVDIRVGSFNIQSVSLDGHRGQQRPWKQRRGKIIRQILGERVAVIGLQEANPSKHFRNRLVSGSNQYLDLKNGLNRPAATSRSRTATPTTASGPRRRTSAATRTATPPTATGSSTTPASCGCSA